MKGNLGWLLARKHPTAETIEAAVELEQGMLLGEIGRINTSLGELEKQKLFFYSRLDEIKKEQADLDLGFQPGACRIRKATQLEERYYPNFNYRSIGVRRGMGTPEVGGGIWLTEAEREIIAAEFRERGYSGGRANKQDDTDAPTAPETQRGEDKFFGRMSRIRGKSGMMEFQFHGGATYTVAQRKDIGTLRANHIVWLTKEEFMALAEDIEKEKKEMELRRRANIKAGMAKARVK